ncbi:MAG: uL15 family ribosomal protein [Candidatus Bathyarchaeia archaeon]
MPTRLRKVRKLRGSRTHGWGRKGQHRKSGSRGGFGRAGLHKHKWSWVLKYEPSYFGKKGFRSPNPKVERSINVGDLEELTKRMELAKEEGNGEVLATLDIAQLGYEKLLGGGRLSIPLLVKAPRATELAMAKVEDAGGKVIVTAKDE